MLSGHLLRDGEVVLLILRPSLWFIPLSVLRFAAAALIFVIAAVLWLPEQRFVHYYVEAGAFALSLRVLWAVLVWLGRLYVLTDQRILRLAGVFSIEIFDCHLRKVATTRVTRTFRERLLRLGSIEITPVDETKPPGAWQTIAKPDAVHEEILEAIRRSRNNGAGWGAE